MSDTIIAFISGSTVAIIASCIAHFLSGRRDRKSNFNTAAEKFRLAFWPEVELFDRRYLVDRASVYTINRSCDILYKAAGRHQHAISEFRHYLKCADRCRLDEAWKQYCKEGNNIHWFSEEYPCDNELKQQNSEKKALKRIYGILEFARPK